MKKILLILGVLFVVFAACKKKSPQTFCYTCVANDSAVSASPAYNDPHSPRANGLSGTKCGLTDALKNALIKQNTYVDTAYANGTMIIDHWTYTCEYEE